MTQKNNIISFSGGKDSTAMLLMMLERKEPIHSVVFFDTGWEFPGMYDHIELLQKNTGVKIWRLHPRLPFEYLLTQKPIKKDGVIDRFGYGWPSMTNRWCTGEKKDMLRYFSKRADNHANECIGISADEVKRVKEKRYPLVEWGVTGDQALQYCYSRGYDWGGLYEKMGRVSCFCCPLQRLAETRNVRHQHPSLWADILRMDSATHSNSSFTKPGVTAHDLDRRFAEEDRQMTMFEPEDQHFKGTHETIRI